jgi:putative tricarboxylic transport membrane protein
MGGYYEFLPQIQAGKLRAIAISAPARMPGADVPTLKEKGVDIEFANWRGLFMPATLKPAEKK